ncbi:MAG: hypothetical protein WBI82_05300 [Sphaerochaeta sp.]
MATHTRKPQGITKLHQEPRFDMTRKPIRQRFYLKVVTWALSFPDVFKHRLKINEAFVYDEYRWQKENTISTSHPKRSQSPRWPWPQRSSSTMKKGCHPPKAGRETAFLYLCLLCAFSRN